MATREEILQERHAAAMDNLHIFGQYLIMQKDCPQKVRDAWRVLKDYIREKQN